MQKSDVNKGPGGNQTSLRFTFQYLTDFEKEGLTWTTTGAWERGTPWQNSLFVLSIVVIKDYESVMVLKLP